MTAPLLLANALLTGREGLYDVLLDAGRVAAVVPAGSDVEVATGVRTRVAERVDVAGRRVIPGLWDMHTHMTQWAMVRRRLDVSAATSAEHAARLVRAGLDDPAYAPAPGLPLVGFGFRWAAWPQEPTAAVLDAVAGEVPVVLLSGDLHTAWASTAGMRYLGVEHPTGLLREEEWMPASPRLVALPDDVTDALVVDAAAAAAARGVVGVVDLEVADNLAVWRRRATAGWEGLRVRAGVWEQYLDAVLTEGLRTGDPLVPGAAHGVPRAGSDALLAQGPLKVISDGSLNTLTAFCFDPYPGVTGQDAHGVLNVAPDHLVPLMTRAHQGGLRCAIHAIGDHANALALDAFAASGARGSVEHAQLLRWEDVERFAALGVVASVQPEHAMDDRDLTPHLWPGRDERTFPLASLLRAGVTLQLGSDAPVAPLDPWQAVASATTRSRDGREPWHPEQRIDLVAALEASVDGLPLALAPGMPADLAVLDTDPLAVGHGEGGRDGDGGRGGAADPREVATALRSTVVGATLVAGRFTHRAL
ncbi:amidohydrolase [Xylanimonas oleitrophica]|uniref:Amidohydrolase n=1 Tax=Xylanimonas oleitrophica TaxID=2607479 RepID=A0A2W5WNL9_9MICO|nr:amidohydrolase family protein [Xylanimonas oleitrophica]PZR52947.1 amidohydrolase [Xylanimonas oleitrophica]